VTAGSNVFIDRRWLRMLDALDLAPLLKGEATLRYVVATQAGNPVAICPFLVTRSRSIYFFYSLEKFFFTAWQAELLRLDPGRAGWIRWVSRLVAAYRRLARATGASTDGWILAVSPLSHRGDIALVPMPHEEAERVRQSVLQTLQAVARRQNLPLCFFGVEQEKTALRRSLIARGFEELFLVYDNLLAVPGNCFSDYLDQFRSDARRLFSREMKQAREAGVRFEVTSSIGSLSGQLERLYHATYSKYGEEHFHHPASFWAALEQYVAPHAEALVAYDGDRPVGFSLLLEKHGELWFYRVGRSYDGVVGEAPVYFNLAFYEPVKRAIARGARRIWLGAGAWEAKRRRGATGYPLYSYLWFPRRWARAVLLPYLKGFTQISREQMAAATQPSAYLKARVDPPAGAPTPHRMPHPLQPRRGSSGQSQG
jgi:predicted N-acyltransferase